MQCLSYPLAPMKCSPNYRLQGHNFIRMTTVLQKEGCCPQKGQQKTRLILLGSESSLAYPEAPSQLHLWPAPGPWCQGSQQHGAKRSARTRPAPRGLRGALSEHGSELHRPESLLWFFLGLSPKRRQKTPLENLPPATEGTVVKPSLWTTSSRRDVKTVPEMTMK